MLNMQAKNKIQGGKRAREARKRWSPHSSQIPTVRLPPRARSRSRSLSPPRSQHPHHDARITPGRGSPPSAPPPAAPSSFASSPPPQLSEGRGGQSARGRRRARGEPRGSRSRGRAGAGRRAERGGGRSRPTAATERAAAATGARSVPRLIHHEQQVGAASQGGCPAAILSPALGDLPLRH